MLNVATIRTLVFSLGRVKCIWIPEEQTVTETVSVHQYFTGLLYFLAFIVVGLG